MLTIAFMMKRTLTTIMITIITIHPKREKNLAGENWTNIQGRIPSNRMIIQVKISKNLIVHRKSTPHPPSNKPKINVFKESN